MKVYAVVGAGSCFDSPFPAPVFLGIYQSREKALEVLKSEWERVQCCVEEGEDISEERRRDIDAEWNALEEPIVMADEDAFRIFEWEMQDAATS